MLDSCMRQKCARGKVAFGGGELNIFFIFMCNIVICIICITNKFYRPYLSHIASISYPPPTRTDRNSLILSACSPCQAIRINRVVCTKFYAHLLVIHILISNVGQRAYDYAYHGLTTEKIITFWFPMKLRGSPHTESSTKSINQTLIKYVLIQRSPMVN